MIEPEHFEVQSTGQKLKFPVVTCLRHFMLSLPFLYMIGLNALHHRTFSPILYRKGGECMKCLKYITTGNSSFRPVIPEWIRLLAAECYSGLYEEGEGETNLSCNNLVCIVVIHILLLTLLPE